MVKAGDFIQLDFTAKDQNGKTFETTSEAEAKKSGIQAKENTRFAPILVIAGSQSLPEGLDEALLQSKEGEHKTITLTPEKAFGQRKEELVRIVPLSQFKQNDVQPAPGMIVEADGMLARVQSVSAGRVRLDFNHELAGQQVTYDYKIVKVIHETNEKVVALTHEILDPRIKTEFNDGSAKIFITGKDKKDGQYFVAKTRLAERALRYIPELRKIVFVEEYERPEAPSLK